MSIALCIRLSERDRERVTQLSDVTPATGINSFLMLKALMSSGAAVMAPAGSGRRSR
jgi:hypothetical protein